MKSTVILFLVMFLYYNVHPQETIIQYISGKDKDHTVQWDFMCTSGSNGGKWSKISVPSCWEQQGFGTFNYFQDLKNPDEKGFYKYSFKTKNEWDHKNIFIVFEGSMTDTEVKIDGQIVGPVHQGSFYQFRYDISNFVKERREHLLEVQVSKKSTNNSINRAERQADFWMFGGIFRPVFLEVVPYTFIDRVAIDAKANGNFGIQVFSKNSNTKQRIEIQVQELNGKPIGKPFSQIASDSNFIANKLSGIRKWNVEQPNLYNALISIRDGNKIIHTIKQRFGFRTVELRPLDGFYCNDVKVIFKGVCRHSQWPESGRTLSRAIHLLDIGLIKSMNMNAVRMSHYPPDREFLDLCDSLGLFVLDELTGWQKAYDTFIGHKLVKELVIRDVNHPSIVIWDNGNEGGWNRSLDQDYQLYDPQKRLVIHPWERFNGTNTKHYPDFNYIQKEIVNAREVFFPTEFMHGLFDGGHAAALEDMWNEMMKHPHAAGGFLWSFHDEGVVRVDQHDSIDVAGNGAPDGILGPHREKEGSYYTIKELWSPIYINSKSGKIFTNKIEVENRYLYTNLSKCKFQYKILSLPTPGLHSTIAKLLQTGSFNGPFLNPGNKTFLNIPLLKNNKADVIYLIAFGPKGDTVCTWSWPLKEPLEIVKSGNRLFKSKPYIITEDENILKVLCDNTCFNFNKKTGFITNVSKASKMISLHGGPSKAGSDQILKSFTHWKEGKIFVIQSIYMGDSLSVKWFFQSGKLPKMVYSFIPKDTSDYEGISFDYPESKMTGMKWMGRGPFRVWKNRLKGQQLGIWYKKYNNTVTGQNWDYPEFKGWHSEIYWVQFQNNESNFIVYTDQPNIYLQMLKPDKPKAAGNNNTSPQFPPGSIGFMHAISPIGTKFQKADLMGPQSQKNLGNKLPFIGSLYFDFK